MKLLRYDAARLAIEAASRVDEAKDIADQAKALASYARQRKDPDLELWLSEIRVRAERRCGEISAALETGQGANQHRPSAGTKLDALKAAGLSKSAAHRCERIAQVPEEAFETYLADCRERQRPVTGEDVVRAVLRARRHEATSGAAEERGETCRTSDLAALIGTGMRFGTVYADPPWQYGNQATRASTDNHYTTMNVEQIAALPVRELAADAAHLHLWTTNAFLFDARTILEAWGFTYKSLLIWVKPELGIGNYWRVSHELMLLGLRGDCPFRDRSQRSWLECSRGAHSEKPEQVRTMIEKVSPGPRLELFARRVSPGWVAWGNEVDRELFAGSAREIAA